MNRADFQSLARVRIKEARILLDNRRYEGAYYLAGYSIECALKACITRQVRRHDFPDKKLVRDFFTHNLETLIGLARLETDLRANAQANKSFGDNWNTVKDWNESFRYETVILELKARALYLAITNTRNGVLPWLKRYW